MKKKLLAILLTVCMVISMAPAALAAGTNPFTDVGVDDWYYDEVQYVYENDLMKGTSTTTFSPDVTVNRAMMVTILYRLEGAPAVSTTGSFTDVPAGQYYTDAVEWAKENKITAGYGDGLFGPNDLLTREQMATFFYRYAEFKGFDVSASADLSDYTDLATVGSYALDAFKWTNANGLIKGTTTTTLSPKGDATRGQLSVILYRFCENVVADAVETHTVTFDYNYSNKGTYTTVSVEDGSKVEKPSNPTRSSYSFSGWYTKASGGSKFDFDTAVTADLTLYARWSYNGGGGGGGSSHSHTYGAWVSNDDGTHTRTCTCGHVGSQTASCTYVEGVCSVCGYDSTAVAKIGDTYYATLTAALDTVANSDPVEIVILKTGDTALTTNIKIEGGRNITLRGITGNAADVKLNGQIATTSSTAGTLTIKDVTILVDSGIVDSTGISQTGKSAIAVWGNQTVNCENVVFDMSLSDSTAITGWWDTGVGTTINAKDCVFNCNGQRPLRSCGNMTVEGCTFNDPYRYAIQLTAKASTATELENAVVIFKNNTINAGTTSSKNVVYGIQLEGESYGCSNLIVNGEENKINLGETGKTGTMYYCECGKVDHTTLVWNTEVPAVHKDSNFAPVAMIGGVEYSSFADAVAAVQNDETIVILPGTYAEVLDVRGGKTFTVKAEEAGTVIIAGINQQTNGDAASTVTFENLTIDNSKATEGWFTGTAQNIFPCVGAWGGNLSFENCTFEVAGTSKKETGIMTWWTTNKVTLSFNECTFNGIDDHESARAMQIYGNVDMTVTDCEFNTCKDYTLKYVGNEGCTATLSGNKVYNSENFAELGSSVYPGSKYTVFLSGNTLGEGVSNYVIANDEDQIVYVDGAQAISSADELAAALSDDAETINVVLCGDITVPVASLSQYGQTPGSGEYKLGGDNTTAITIDLNGHKLTLTTSYMTAIGAKNEDATITIKNGSMNGTGNSATTWNINDLIFANCNYVFEDVTFDKEVALCNTGKTVTMTDVTIKGTGDYYALWIQAEGQTVEIDGLTVETTGRGIKIDEQYVSAENLTKVTLKVSDAKFTTAKKAAIMVKSAAGADVNVTSIDITSVAADATNAVWVDSDAAAYADLVTVTGATKIVES